MNSVVTSEKKSAKFQQEAKRGEKEIDDIKPIVEFCTMSNELKKFCIEKAKEALKTTVESSTSFFKKLAKKLKNELELDKNETWNCIVGTDYGAFLSFEKANLIYFRLDEIYFLLFRFGAAQK